MAQIQGWDDPALDLELFVCTNILKLKSLHYGYWDSPVSGKDINLDDIRAAQKRYTETLLEMIPEGVTTILDVGCGIGDISHELAARGYQVTSISPDRNHISFFQGCNGNPKFINTCFETFGSNEQFDMVLMSESQGYMDQEMIFGQCNRIVKPGGNLLVSGLFKKEKQSAFSGAQIESEFIKTGQDYFFVKREHVDITEKVLPTLDFGFHQYQEYFQPGKEVISKYLKINESLKFKLLGLVFGREIEKLKKVEIFYRERLNPEIFRNVMCYSRILFELNPDAVIAQHEKKLKTSVVIN